MRIASIFAAAGLAWTLALPALGQAMPGELILRPVVGTPSNWTSRTMALAAAIISKRLTSFGIQAPVVGLDRQSGSISVQLPKGKRTAELEALVTRPGRLEFRLIPQMDHGWTAVEERLGGKPTGFEVLMDPKGPIPADRLKALFAAPAAFTGSQLEPNCRADEYPGGSVIHFSFKPAVRLAFEAFTKRSLKRHLGIFLDHRLICAPFIEDAIPGAGIIRGQFTADRARSIAAQLNSGVLPVALKVERPRLTR